MSERERERAREQGSSGRRGRERGREKVPSSLCAASAEPDTGLSLTNGEIMA